MPWSDCRGISASSPPAWSECAASTSPLANITSFDSGWSTTDVPGSTAKGWRSEKLLWPASAPPRQNE
eukprot:2348552-Pyramimonas_sp.AAC.1